MLAALSQFKTLIIFVTKLSRKPKVGEIVYHYLFTTTEWKAIVLDTDNLPINESKTLVRMLPGVILENYFNKGFLKRGWIYTKWIWLREDQIF